MEHKKPEVKPVPVVPIVPSKVNYPFTVEAPIADRNLLPAKLRGLDIGIDREDKNCFEGQLDIKPPIWIPKPLDLPPPPSVPQVAAKKKTTKELPPLAPLTHADCPFTLLVTWQGNQMTNALENAYNSLGLVLDMTRMGMTDHHYVHGNFYTLLLHAVDLDAALDAIKSEYAGLIGGHSNCVVRKGTESSYNLKF